MRSRCLSCGYLHHEIELNCSKCSNFYTEIIDDDKSTEKVKHQPKQIKPMEFVVNKCLSCGELRPNLELNCPKCGSFYSKIIDDFSMDEVKAKKISPLVKIKTHLEHPKHRLMAIGMVIFLIITVIFL